MSSAQKIIQAAAGNAGAGEATYVEDVFSTYLYTGNASAKTITNGIDLDGEGGMVWGKSRSVSGNHRLHDSERGSDNTLSSNSTATEVTGNGIASFNSDGFTMDSGTNINQAYDYASWTFRKAPKFFDVVTYTGTGSGSSTVSHNLGTTPGCIIVKARTDGDQWYVWHRSFSSPTLDFLQLNTTDAVASSALLWNSTAPTSTEFSIGPINNGSFDYVAYLFAHNDGDGEFGETGDQDIIKCGSYTGNGTAGNEINLGFEPQWVLVKATETGGSADSWFIYDAMRGMTDSGFNALYPNLTNAEEAGTSFLLYPTATGFKMGNTFPNNSGIDMIYIAIRRGPMKTPESGTEVFAQDYRHNATPAYTSGFPVDWAFQKRESGTTTTVRTRMLGTNYLDATSTVLQTTLSTITWDYNDGMESHTSDQTDKWMWMFRRAPGFFDVVSYSGDATNPRAISHNLGVTPELIIAKKAGGLDTQEKPWPVYHSALGNSLIVKWDQDSAETSDPLTWASAPTSSVFNVSADNLINKTNSTYIAYLFATLPGVSKVGSYIGNGTSQTIDCGFSTGARFVMIKRTDSTGDWHVYDSERGIVAGNDPRLEINTADAEDTGSDDIDPVSSGFSVTSNADVNTNTAEYIFLAIA